MEGRAGWKVMKRQRRGFANVIRWLGQCLISKNGTGNTIATGHSENRQLLDTSTQRVNIQPPEQAAALANNEFGLLDIPWTIFATGSSMLEAKAQWRAP
jgi:hypothetical protein